MTEEKVKVFVAGTRGIPDIQGGVETHSEHLYPLLVEKGVEITLARRSGYVRPENMRAEYKGVRLVDLYSPGGKSLEAVVHTFLAVLKAKKLRFKQIHIHAIGPSLVIPVARLLGLRVVMTHHGPDYDRQKWGPLAKTLLKAGEWCAVRFANEIIVISNTIKTLLLEKYNRGDTHLIYNGVTFPERADQDDYIRELGLEPRKYLIAVGRFVPEKGFHDLLNVAGQIHSGYKIVLVGDADHESAYSQQLKRDAAERGIVLTGFIKGEKLNQVFSHASLFVMPSYHEGLPIALLEAMSYNLKVAVSNIPANMEVGLESESYFELGNAGQMVAQVNQMLERLGPVDYSDVLREKYDWQTIADQTLSVYRLLSI